MQISWTIPTFSTENLRDTILLMQEAFLVHLVEEATLPVPRGDRCKVLLALLPGSQIAHLDDYKRVFSGRSGREQDVGVELAGSAFDAVSKVLDERRGCGTVESAVEGKCSN